MVLVGCCEAILAIFLPPLAVLLRRGCGGSFLLNIILTILGWLPGNLHDTTTRDDPATAQATPTTTAPHTPAVTTTTTTITATDTTTAATPDAITLGPRGGATIVLRIAMGMMSRQRRRGMGWVRRRRGTGLRRKWGMRRRGGIEGRRGWVEESAMLR
ncbi:hypothetical protein Q7P35_012392 [Cladosporium inversicolor]